MTMTYDPLFPVFLSHNLGMLQSPRVIHCTEYTPTKGAANAAINRNRQGKTQISTYRILREQAGPSPWVLQVEKPDNVELVGMGGRDQVKSGEVQ